MDGARNNRLPAETPPDIGGGSGQVRATILMVFEEDLRKASGKRVIEPPEQCRWVELRRNLPISEWAERPGHEIGPMELGRLKRELTRYLEIFEAEAAERGLKLDMDRNYYSEALSRLAECRRNRLFTAQDRDLIRELMILVDWKDAVLGLQILRSVV